ncbi:peptidyl-prolyl cis-trans isomerase [Luteolibacter yonseiensis]|uniref:Peptidyl-prolyl cis-trans isomerase n=1 Tax=Luteolibacter yonseiensis TaxID=1144680 RepID=A0A934VAC1_9BACT|nr:peptidylprolyl isomerase [Luteolibacter yonseiensis]MBK1814209.1 peptidyl-prolyl cis-trans isomerase [Luteolibacter yonseiensis]
MHRILREPLFHFLAVAAMILAADGMWSRFRKPEIIVSAAAVESRAREWQATSGIAPTAGQRSQIARDLATEEVLFRESLKREMATDNRVRSSLVGMMRSALKPPVTPPTDEELKEVLSNSPKENIMLPAQIGFESVTYTNDADVPPDLLKKLRDGAPVPASTAAVKLANPLPPTYRPQLDRLLGTAFCDAVFTLPLHQWQGPIRSTRGVHFVRVTTREVERPIPFAEIRGMLEAKWIEGRENETIAVEAAKLAQNYRIVLPDPAATPAPAKP